jgi:VPDSG-CTERM motif/Carbohydrate binding domain
MNKLRPILLALTTVAALSVAYPAKANLVTNPGFETGNFTGWTQSGDTSFTGVIGTNVNGIPPHSGNFQAALGNTTTGFLSQMLALAAGTTYTVDFWLVNNVSGTNSFAASLGGVTGFSLTNAGAFGYTEHTFNFTYTGGSTQLLFTFLNVPGEWLLDDVSVNAVGTVPDGGTTISLLGCALLGLAALRRKLSC